MNEETPALRSESREPRGGSIVAGRYRVDRLIARGGMSTVYLAHQTKLNRPVALKVLSPPPSGDDAAAFEQRFRREAQTLAQLDHNNIVVLHDYGETEDGRYYLAMEYIDGPRLSDLLKDGPLPVQEALNLLIQVCAGLRYAHRRGVVHRDLKPSNLLVRRSDEEMDQVKIVDFGLVKLVETDQSITRAGLILGSPHCMAPEQVKGLQIDHRADIYAVGILLFRTITGQYPFHGTNSAATMIAHLNQAIPTFYSVAPEVEVPPGLEEVVRRCLAKHPADRYPDMRELIEAITPLMDVPPEGLGIRTLTHTHSMLPGLEYRGGRKPRGLTGAAVAAAVFGSASLLALFSVVVALITVGVLQSQGVLLPPRCPRSWQAPPAPVAPIAPAPAPASSSRWRPALQPAAPVAQPAQPPPAPVVRPKPRPAPPPRRLPARAARAVASPRARPLLLKSTWKCRSRQPPGGRPRGLPSGCPTT
ncbi:MAG: serine/threonine-protein kinase [Myxococcota bacterium]